MKKILITGGPVHAHLDDVKIVTNRFKGGLMARLANLFVSAGYEVFYLSAKGAALPTPCSTLTVIQHNGFHDYQDKVVDLCPDMDGILLGAAVANLIPRKRIEGKFPSHNYKPGDIIPIEFTIAPRVIDLVQTFKKKNAHLFGFKLLSGVPHEELLRAAYEVLLGSKATAVFANDAQDLQTVYGVTKERGRHPMLRDDIVNFVGTCLDDQYYRTQSVAWQCEDEEIAEQMGPLINKWGRDFVEVEDFKFGTVAIRQKEGFFTTARGKNEIKDYTHVVRVDHSARIVETARNRKATLNAPLLAHIFDTNPSVDHIVHLHKEIDELDSQEYAPSGTVRDSIRPCSKSFNILGHGCVLLFDKEGRQL